MFRSFSKRRKHRLFNLGDQLLAAGKPGVQLVPVGDFGLAQLPAQVDLAAIHVTGEIDEAGEVILEFDAELGEFVHVGLHACPDRVSNSTTMASTSS